MIQPLIIAHRGASFHAPENTFPAFERAIADGAHGIELDVRLTRDRIPICIHDATLRRTGLRPERIAAADAAALARFDVGSWFNARFPPRADASYTRAVLPTLADALRFFRCSTPKGFRVYVEMKCARGAEQATAEATADVLSEIDDHLDLVVASFAIDAIRHFKTHQPTARTAALFETTLIAPRPSIDKLINEAIDAGADELMLHRNLITTRNIERAAMRKLPVTLWTVDDTRWARRAVELDLRAVITNKPALMLLALERLSTR